LDTFDYVAFADGLNDLAPVPVELANCQFI